MGRKGNDFLNGVAKSLATAIALAVLGGIWTTYMTVRDLKTQVEDVRGKMDWLFKYQFGEKHD